MQIPPPRVRPRGKEANMNGVVKEYVTPTRLYDYETVCGAVGGTYPE